MDIAKARQRFTDADHVAQPRPPELDAVAADAIVEVDVREDLRSGNEPFSRIMAAQQSLAPGRMLRLRAIFEPVPLYAALARFGLSHWTVRHADDDWEVWFYHAGAASSQPLKAAKQTAPAANMETVVLDVRGLEPPEPMQRTLELLENLPARTAVLQINARVPQFLLPLLEERGFQYAVVSEQPGEVSGLITRINEEPSMSDKEVTRELDVRVIPPREKHPAIFQTFDKLDAGAAFVLINDHDPFPLRYQFAAERKDQFTWDYLEQGPVVWRVRISKVAA